MFDTKCILNLQDHFSPRAQKNDLQLDRLFVLFRKIQQITYEINQQFLILKSSHIIYKCVLATKVIARVYTNHEILFFFYH